MFRESKLVGIGALVVVVLTSGASAVVIQPDEAASKDVFTYEGLSTFNFETAGPSFQAILAAGNTGSSSAHSQHTLIEFDLSGVSLTAAEVTGATLHLYSIDPSAAGFGVAATTSDPVDIALTALGGSWSESTVTWDTEPGTTGSTVDTVTVDGIDKWITWDVTDLVKDWLDGTLTNNGMFLEQVAEVRVGGQAVVTVYNSASASTNRPYLEIVPEPATALLLGAGVVFGVRRRKRRR